MFPVHLELFGRTVYFFEGIYMLLGFILGFLWSWKLKKVYEIDTTQFLNLVLMTFLGGVLGSKIFEYLFYSSKMDAFTLNGGMSITGAVILGPVFNYIYCYFQKIDYWKMFAIGVPVILFGQGVGRMGCFMNGDAFGVATDGIFGMKFPKYGYRIPSFELDTTSRGISKVWAYSYENGLIEASETLSAKVHPAQLYEAVFDFLLCYLLYRLLKYVTANNANYKIVPLCYLLGYSVFRFFIEFIKVDSAKESGALLSDMQWVLLTLVVVIAACANIIFIIRPSRNR